MYKSVKNNNRKLMKYWMNINKKMNYTLLMKSPNTKQKIKSYYKKS